MDKILLLLQLANSLYSLYQVAEQDGTAEDVQKVFQDFMAELAKPETQDVLKNIKPILGLK